MQSVDVVRYYEATDEPGRLHRDRGPLEFVRVQELVRRFAPRPPAAVIDVGGAGGVHAAWLADEGYDVLVIDLVPKHIEAAQQLSASLPRAFASQVGDARDLRVPDERYDLVLLLGPLYHLARREDRLTVWAEAARVARPGGAILGKVISCWAATLDMFFRPPAEQAPGFVSVAYFHAPDEAAAEASEAGLEVIGTFGVEGPGLAGP